MAVCYGFMLQFSPCVLNKPHEEFHTYSLIGFICMFVLFSKTTLCSVLSGSALTLMYIVFPPRLFDFLSVCSLCLLRVRGVLRSMFGRRFKSFHCSLTCTTQCITFRLYPLHNPEEEISSEWNIIWSQMIYIGWINNFLIVRTLASNGPAFPSMVSSKVKENKRIKPLIFFTFIARYTFINDSGILEILMANSVFKCRHRLMFLCSRQKETMRCQELD